MEEEECTDYCFSYPIARSYGPKLPALLSVLGSYVVIREVVANNNLLDRSKTIPRLLLAMSISDILFSAPYLFTTWAMPPHDNLFQSSGSFATCTLQGVSLQLGVSTSPLYNVAISFTALLMIRFEWRKARIFVVETCLHILIWVYGLLATIPFIFWGMFNPTSTCCWIASYPHHCGIKETDSIECIRGDGAGFWRGFFAFFPTWPCIGIGLTNMFFIYLSVRKMETRNLRWRRESHIPAGSEVIMGPQPIAPAASTDASSGNPTLHTRASDSRSAAFRMSAVDNTSYRTRSRAVATQAIFYTCAFLLTFSLDTIVLFWQVMTLNANQVLIVWAYILFPMQGWFNAIVYVRTANLRTPEGRCFHRVFLCCGPLYQRFFARSSSNGILEPVSSHPKSSSAPLPRREQSHDSVSLDETNNNGNTTRMDDHSVGDDVSSVRQEHPTQGEEQERAVTFAKDESATP